MRGEARVGVWEEKGSTRQGREGRVCEARDGGCPSALLAGTACRDPLDATLTSGHNQQWTRQETSVQRSSWRFIHQSCPALTTDLKTLLKTLPVSASSGVVLTVPKQATD